MENPASCKTPVQEISLCDDKIFQPETTAVSWPEGHRILVWKKMKLFHNPFVFVEFSSCIYATQISAALQWEEIQGRRRWFSGERTQVELVSSWAVTGSTHTWVQIVPCFLPQMLFKKNKTTHFLKLCHVCLALWFPHECKQRFLQRVLNSALVSPLRNPD